eukprot:4287687-Amphidinium_carterae.1
MVLSAEPLAADLLIHYDNASHCGLVNPFFLQTLTLTAEILTGPSFSGPQYTNDTLYTPQKGSPHAVS